MQHAIINYQQLRMQDAARVGEDLALLGEVRSQLGHSPVKVPAGFAITADAWRLLRRHNHLETPIDQLLGSDQPPADIASEICRWLEAAAYPSELEQRLRQACSELAASVPDGVLAIQSPEAGRGQPAHAVPLGDIDTVMETIKHALAVCYSQWVVARHVETGEEGTGDAPAIGIQRAVPVQAGASGLIDTGSGPLIRISLNTGTGKVVGEQSEFSAQFYVSLPLLEAGQPAVIGRYAGLGEPASLSDTRLETLAGEAQRIRQRLGRRVLLEWRREGRAGPLFIVKVRSPGQAEAAAALPFEVMLNVDQPEQAAELARLTAPQGSGQLRLDALWRELIGIHPRAVLEPERQPEAVRRQVEALGAGFASPRAGSVARLADGMATAAAAYYPRPLLVRLSEMSAADYARLAGGQPYERQETNPVLGQRGAVRHVDPRFADGFKMECEAIRRVRETLGLTNVALLVPVVRSVCDAAAILDVLAQHGLKRGAQGMPILMLCDAPATALLTARLLRYFDGMVIDLASLVLLTQGQSLAPVVLDKDDEAVVLLLASAMRAARQAAKSVGVCTRQVVVSEALLSWLVAYGAERLGFDPEVFLTRQPELAGLLPLEPQPPLEYGEPD